jgi:hypothetical protein
MDEEFESFVVTDPDLVDEGIDVSGLRTKTDTSLLGNIPELAGVQYEAFNPNRLTDLMRFYQTGLPTRSVSQPTTPPATGGGGSGGGGQAITPTTSITDGTNINTPGGLTQSGTFGGQPTFTTTPGTTVDNITGDITNPDGSYSGNIVDEVALTGGTISPTTQPIDPSGMLPQTSTPFMVEGALGVDPLEKNDVSSGAITAKDAADPTFLDRIGLGQFNPAEALIKTAINTAVGKPVTFLIDFLKNNLPPQDPRQVALNEFYKTDDIGRVAEGELMAGYNPVSGGFPGISEPTFGLQEAYQKRIDTINKTLGGMTLEEYQNTDLIQRKKDLEEAMAKEKSRLDLFSGDIQETGDANIAEQLYDADRLGISDVISGPPEADRRGGGADIPSGPITTDITSDQIDEFGTAPITGVTRPGTVLGKPGIERFDDAEASIDMFDDLPEGASTTGTPIDSLNPINRQQHFDNTEKLKDAVRAGEITAEEYNRLSAFDATKTMGLGPVTGTAATIGYQGIQTLAGDQSVGDMIGDIGRNIQGVSGNITPEEQVKYQEIITGEKIYRDPILGMVEPPAPMTLADDTINRMTDDVDLDLFDTTPLDTPIAPEKFDTADFGITTTGINPFDADIFDDFDDGTMTGSAADNMDDVLGPMPEPPTPSVPDFIGGGGGGGGGPAPSAPSQPSGPPESVRRGGGADRDPAPSPSPAPSGPPEADRRGGGGGGRDSCFLPDTLVTMADGSTKKIIDVDIGDEVAEGGKVFATGKFLNNELYDYKGVKVSGSHMVNEDGVWMRIRDTKHGKPLGDDEHIVYVFGSENRRILINNILFTDYFETKEQEKLIDNEKDFFNNWKTYGNKIDQDNINILNAS